jgi:universal stress protein A
MTNPTHLYKHILLATDLSDHSDYVAKRAAALAHTMHAKLTVMHVLAYTPIAYAGEFSIPIDAEFETMLEKQATQQLAKLAKKYDIPSEQQYLTQGSVKTAVTDHAVKIKADLIVVGTHGHTGIELLLGSQANGILHSAPCDVWVVHIK